MSKRNDYGQFAKAPSKKMFFGSLVGSIISIGLLYLAALAVWSSFSSFRSCSTNNNGITAVSCGKHGLNFGDIVLLALFILAASMAYSLCVHVYRMLKRMFSK